MKKRNVAIALLLFVLSALLLLIGMALYFGLKSFWPYQYWKFRNTADQCAQNNQLCTFGEIFDFKWDVVYNDRGVYGTGTKFKVKYGLEFEVEPGRNDSEARFLFFYEGKLVKAGYYPKFNIMIPSEIEQIFPDTEFEVRYDNGNEYVLEFIQVTEDE